MGNCPKCGNEIEENQKFCGKCGYDIDAPDNNTSENQIVPTTNNQQPKNNEEKPRTLEIILSVIGGILGIIVGVVALFFGVIGKIVGSPIIIAGFLGINAILASILSIIFGALIRKNPKKHGIILIICSIWLLISVPILTIPGGVLILIAGIVALLDN